MSAVAIVTHCWAVNKPQYAAFLRCQLSSLVLYPPVTKVYPIVAYSKEDSHTRAVVEDFSKQGTGWLQTIELTDGEMWRRAIARHRATQRFAASCDLMWFTDCDYLFGQGCIDSAKAAWLEADKPEMIWPRVILANPEKSFVDKMAARQEKSPAKGLYDATEIDVAPVKMLRAIGGLQITAATHCQQHGYLPQARWQRQPLYPFPDFRDDVAFRRRIEHRFRCVPIEPLPGLIRLRHTEVGYGVDQQNS